MFCIDIVKGYNFKNKKVDKNCMKIYNLVEEGGI